MISFITTAREQHRVATPEAYRSTHAAKIAADAKAGARYVVHDSPGLTVAYISANRWVIDCECGAGNATDPAWGFACCFGCGAVHEHVQFPTDIDAIEQALLSRPFPMNRNWRPSETAETLTAENIEHGVITIH